MTLFCWGNPRYFPRLPPPVRRYFDAGEAPRVVVESREKQPQPPQQTPPQQTQAPQQEKKGGGDHDMY